MASLSQNAEDQDALLDALAMVEATRSERVLEGSSASGGHRFIVREQQTRRNMMVRKKNGDDSEPF